MASSGATFLPEDVVIQILLRLPVKSLLRFKCVCKYWYALIKSPSFISQHYHHHNNRIQLLVHHCIPYIEESAFALFPDEMLVVRQHLDYLHMPTYLTNVVGPVNGLFLLHKDWRSHGSHLALWNPATRGFRTLPGLDSNLPQWFMAEENYLGFGLDPLTNDYKVIWISYFWNEKLRVAYDPPVIGVYTLGTDSWRLLDPDSALMPPRLSSISSIYMNGTQYWLSYYEHFSFSIVAFDMGNEVFRVIQVPPEFTWGCLSLYNDSIALTSGKTVESVASIDIWVMEQEGCWTKHFRIGSLPKFSNPLGFWNNNELFLEDHCSDLLMYNLNSHEIRNIGVRGFEYGLQVFKFKESLVSVDVGKKNLEPHSLSDILQDFFKYKGPKCDCNIRPTCGFCSELWDK